MAEVIVNRLSKSFGKVKAVDDVSFEVKEGEMVTLLGPSGCGKTTTLRLIAGLEKPDRGEIYLGKRPLVITDRHICIPPDKRSMGMVFQSYAVWPHMTIFDNVAFPLKLRRVPQATIKEKVREVLRLVGLDTVEDRGATLLSGGQQQRVAVARALAFSPEVLLLDEPLSNLDAKLRARMRLELRSLQQRLGLTSIFVTHDQLEAMVLSDRLAVMNQGKIEHMGPPGDVYQKPRTRFVMDFIGQVNHLSGKTLEVTPKGCVARATKAGEVLVCQAGDGVGQHQDVTLSIRPEDIVVYDRPPGDRPNVCRCTVKVASYLGERMHYVVGVGDENLDVFTAPRQRFAVGETVFVELDPDSMWVWRADSEHGVEQSRVGNGE